MAMLPQSNARLISVTRGGFTEDYDRPEGAASPTWQGNLDAYVQQKIVSTFNQNGELRRVLQITLIVSGDLPVELEPGDILVYQAGDPNAPQTLAGRVQNSINPAFLAYLPDYYKVSLEETNVP